MLASKRAAFSNQKKKTSQRRRAVDFRYADLPGEDTQDVWSLLSKDIASNLRKSVVSLVRTDDYGYRSAFSGIAIECQTNVTKFVTTGTLAAKLQKRHYKEEIEVYCEGNVVTGHLDEYDSDCQLAVVKVMSALDVCCVHLNHGMECMPCNQLIAVGRRYRSLITTSGEISYGSKDKEFLIFPPASENWLGAAIFYIDGNFVGMNHCMVLPPKIFLERSKSSKVFHYVGMNGWYVTARGNYYFHPMAYDVVDKEQFQDLNSLGYPMPSRSMVNRGMILVNTYEDHFGDLYPKGVWGEFKKRVSSEISRNVIALTSFKGDKRIFACSGVFVNFDDRYPKILTSASLVRDPDDEMIIGDLRIEVLLPSKQCGIGTLELYSLHYNVAVLSVENYRALYPVDLERDPVNLTNDMMHHCMVNDTTVVSIGRIFQSGALMAASGKLNNGSGMLDCRALSYSTCKITKAGIGGPLVDVDGNFIGMNFHGMNYHCKKVGTPYMNGEDLCIILEFLKTKETKKFSLGESIVGDKEPMNKWPVPDPYWRDPSDVEEEQMNDNQELVAYGCRVRYRFGSMSVLK